MHARNTQHVEENIPEMSSVNFWVQTRSTLIDDDAETMIEKSDVPFRTSVDGRLVHTDVKFYSAVTYWMDGCISSRIISHFRMKPLI